MAHIYKVGFEIEGGWDGAKGVAPCNKGKNCCSWIADGSINGQQLAEDPIAATHVGECVSAPIPFEGAWKEWLQTHWPNATNKKHRTNNTCGLHIHISVESLKDYTLLTSKRFLLDVQANLLEAGRVRGLPGNHYYWGRIQGNNPFCLLDFNAVAQMRLGDKAGIHKERYGWMNFAWNIHGTIEFRAFPTFVTAEEALFFTETYLNFVEDWLERNSARPLVREFSL